MSKIVESLKRLNVENGAESTEQDNEKIGEKGELILTMEEVVSHDQNYILSVCGTQRQILNFYQALHVKSAKKMNIFLLYFFYLHVYLAMHLSISTILVINLFV